MSPTRAGYARIRLARAGAKADGLIGSSDPKFRLDLPSARRPYRQRKWTRMEWKEWNGRMEWTEWNGSGMELEHGMEWNGWNGMEYSNMDQ